MRQVPIARAPVLLRSLPLPGALGLSAIGLLGLIVARTPHPVAILTLCS